MDSVGKDRRPEIMSRIRSRGTDIELRMAKILLKLGIRFVRQKKVAGHRPDFIIWTEPGADKEALFVNGCFWHGCREHCRTPKTNSAFWRAKIERNRERQRRAHVDLREAGYSTRVIWEHDLK